MTEYEVDSETGAEMETSIPGGMNGPGGEVDLFEQMLDEARSVEKLTEPRVGRHDGAILIEVQAVEGDNPRLDITWSGLVDSEGREFAHIDRVFFPRVDHPSFVKGRFMQKLKALGVVPQKYDGVFYPDTERKVTMLVEKLEGLIGQQFPITISQDSRGFFNTTVRKARSV